MKVDPWKVAGLAACLLSAVIMGLLIWGAASALGSPITDTWQRQSQLVPVPPHHVEWRASLSPPCGPRAIGCSDGDWIGLKIGKIGRFGYYHEIGHVVDKKWLTRTDRRNLTDELNGRPGASWDWDAFTPWGNTSMSEAFAVVYSLCARTRAERQRFRIPGGYDYPAYWGEVSFGQLARFCGYMRLVDRRHA